MKINVFIYDFLFKKEIKGQLFILFEKKRKNDSQHKIPLKRWMHTNQIGSNGNFYYDILKQSFLFYKLLLIISPRLYDKMLPIINLFALKFLTRFSVKKKKSIKSTNLKLNILLRITEHRSMWATAYIVYHMQMHAY